jgi:hypothetical protein
MVSFNHRLDDVGMSLATKKNTEHFSEQGKF